MFCIAHRFLIKHLKISTILSINPKPLHQQTRICSPPRTVSSIIYTIQKSLICNSSNHRFVLLTLHGGGKALAMAAFIDAEWQPGHRQSYRKSGISMFSVQTSTIEIHFFERQDYLLSSSQVARTVLVPKMRSANVLPI